MKYLIYLSIPFLLLSAEVQANNLCGNGQKDSVEQCDPTDSSQQGWGNKGCDASCKQVQGRSCNQDFYYKLRYGRGYRFADAYHNNGKNPHRLKTKRVQFSENGGDYDGKNLNLNLDWTREIKNKKWIVNPNDKMATLRASEKNIYNVKHYPKNRAESNVKLTYTYGTTELVNGIEKGYYYHTSCVNYEITRCGDGLVDSYTERNGYKVNEACDDGNTNSGDGCSSSCAIE